MVAEHGFDTRRQCAKKFVFDPKIRFVAVIPIIRRASPVRIGHTFDVDRSLGNVVVHRRDKLSFRFSHCAESDKRIERHGIHKSHHAMRYVACRIWVFWAYRPPGA